jgi:hypothetical protein
LMIYPQIFRLALALFLTFWISPCT